MIELAEAWIALHLWLGSSVCIAGIATVATIATVANLARLISRYL